MASVTAIWQNDRTTVGFDYEGKLCEKQPKGPENLDEMIAQERTKLLTILPTRKNAQKEKTPRTYKNVPWNDF